MSEGLNKVQLIGNLGADPELRFSQGGNAVMKLRVATTESYLDREKVRRERTDWHSCVIFGKRAEGLGKVLRKGSRVYVEGQLRSSSYEKDGQKRYKTEVIVGNVILCDGGRGNGGERSNGDAYPRDDFDAPANGGDMGGFEGSDDDSIPFMRPWVPEL